MLLVYQMSSLSKHVELQANNAVNGLLDSLLPGAKKISSEGRRLKSSRGLKGSKAQLIDRNLKRTVELQERDVESLKKRQRKVKKRAVRANKKENDRLEQLAKLSVLEKHKEAGTLTGREQKYLNTQINRNARRAKSWDLEDEDKEELRELQKQIIDQTGGVERSKRSQKRRKRVKEFRAEISQQSSDRRYPGLTPGLAPVGLSDEEDSSEED